MANLNEVEFMNDRKIISFQDLTPKISENVFIADGARIIGDVTIEEYCSIWFNTVVRGEKPILIKKGTNIQDNSTIHIGSNFPCIIGENVTVGHNALIHGCIIADACLIGMGAIISSDVKIEEFSVVAAGSIVPQGKSFPPRSLIMGSPAKVVRTLSDEDIQRLIMRPAETYKKRGQIYLSEQTL